MIFEVTNVMSLTLAPFTTSYYCFGATISNLPPFRDIATFTAYMTTYNLQKSFGIDKTFNIIFMYSFHVAFSALTLFVGRKEEHWITVK